MMLANDEVSGKGPGDRGVGTQRPFDPGSALPSISNAGHQIDHFYLLTIFDATMNKS
jgi:hypothetical protein